MQPKKNKRKYDRKVLPPSEIKTRGVKLPSYSQGMYERKNKKLKAENGEALDGLNVLLAPDRQTSTNEKTPLSGDSQDSGNFDLIYGYKSVCTFKDEVKLRLTSNPLDWSVQEVVDYIKGTDSAQFARILKEQVWVTQNYDYV